MTEGRTSSPGTIERDLDHTRSRLDSNLDALTQRLSPGQMVDEAMSFFKRGGGAEFGQNMARQVRDQPLALALVGVGLTWLIAGGRGGQDSHVRDYRDDVDLGERARLAGTGLSRRTDETSDLYDERVTTAQGEALGLRRESSESSSAFRDRVDSGMKSASARFANLRARVSSTGSSLADRGRGAGRSVSGGLSSSGETMRGLGSDAFSAFQQNPLLAAAFGISAGAVLAALLPTSRYEEEMLSDVSRTAREKLRETGAPIAEKLGRVAERTADAATDAAFEEGIMSSRQGSSSGSSSDTSPSSTFGTGQGSSGGSSMTSEGPVRTSDRLS